MDGFKSLRVVNLRHPTWVGVVRQRLIINGVNLTKNLFAGPQMTGLAKGHASVLNGIR